MTEQRAGATAMSPRAKESNPVTKKHQPPHHPEAGETLKRLVPVDCEAGKSWGIRYGNPRLFYPGDIDRLFLPG
jgi:hypothetical protein